MKRKFVFLIFSTLFIGLATITVPAMADSIPEASLSLLNTPGDVGDAFKVEVFANGNKIGLGLLAFGFDVSFDKGGIFDYAGYALEPEFLDTSLGPNNVSGMALSAISDEKVLLATLDFTTLAAGTDTLRVKGLYDGMFSGLYYESAGPDLTGYDIDRSLTVKAGSPPVPEPASVLLVGTGLIGAIGGKMRKRKKASAV